MNLEDVVLDIDPCYTKKGKLNELLRSSKTQQAQSSTAKKDSTNEKTSSKLDISAQKKKLEEALGLHTPNRNKGPKLQRSGGSGGDTIRKMFDRGLNSDQKMFMDRYDDYPIHFAQRGILDSDGPIQLEENARFSDDGNNSIPDETAFEIDRQGYYKRGKEYGMRYRDEGRNGLGQRILNYEIHENPDHSDPHYNRPYNPMMRQGPDPRPGQPQKQFADVPYQPQPRERHQRQTFIDIDHR